MKKLENKVALVTGSGGGIGREIALVFAGNGCSVVVSDIHEAACIETVEMISSRGGVASYIKADVGKESDVVALVNHAISTFGSLDIAVNNAGIGPAHTSIHEMSQDDWDQIIKTDLTGVFLCAKHELAYMREQSAGVILNISSAAALKLAPGSNAYSVAKQGVLTLTSCIAIESADCGVRANAILPGMVLTSMLQQTIDAMPELEAHYSSTIPLKRFADADEIAAAALWLCSDDASYVTGQHIGVCGGLTV